MALFGSGKAEADAVSVLLDAANARISRAVLLGQQSGGIGGAASAASPGATAFAAVEMTDAGFWKGGSGQQQQQKQPPVPPADLLTLAAARGPANLKARPGADRAAARQEATFGVASEDFDFAAAAAGGGGFAAAAMGGEAGGGGGGGGAGRVEAGAGGRRWTVYALVIAALAILLADWVSS